MKTGTAMFAPNMGARSLGAPAQKTGDWHPAARAKVKRRRGLGNNAFIAIHLHRHGGRHFFY
jgi:hypothetical protein